MKHMTTRHSRHLHFTTKFIPTHTTIPNHIQSQFKSLILQPLNRHPGRRWRIQRLHIDPYSFDEIHDSDDVEAEVDVAGSQSKNKRSDVAKDDVGSGDGEVEGGKKVKNVEVGGEGWMKLEEREWKEGIGEWSRGSLLEDLVGRWSHETTGLTETEFDELRRGLGRHGAVVVVGVDRELEEESGVELERHGGCCNSTKSGSYCWTFSFVLIYLTCGIGISW